MQTLKVLTLPIRVVQRLKLERPGPKTTFCVFEDELSTPEEELYCANGHP